MKKHIFKTVTDFCPVANCDRTIKIEYEEVPMTGSLVENYKAVSVNCPYSGECQEKYCTIAKNNSVITL